MIGPTQLWYDLMGCKERGPIQRGPCAACGTDPGLGFFLPTFAPTFPDYAKFRGTTDVFCAPCYMVYTKGDMVKVGQKQVKQSWLLSKDCRTPVKSDVMFKMGWWLEQMLNPPAPPFVFSIQPMDPLTRRYTLLLGAQIGWDRDWYPVAFENFQLAWVDRPRLREILSHHQDLFKYDKMLEKGVLPSAWTDLADCPAPFRQLLRLLGKVSKTTMQTLCAPPIMSEDTTKETTHVNTL